MPFDGPRLGAKGMPASLPLGSAGDLLPNATWHVTE
jgi:hypothetical protein